MTRAEKDQSKKAKADKAAKAEEAQAAIQLAEDKEAEKVAKEEDKAEAKAKKEDEAEAKHKHFIHSVYLSDFGICIVGDRATAEHIKAIKKEDLSKYVG